MDVNEELNKIVKMQKKKKSGGGSWGGVRVDVNQELEVILQGEVIQE